MITFTPKNFDTNLGFSTESRAVETLINLFWSEQHRLTVNEKNEAPSIGSIYWLDGNRGFNRYYLHRAAREKGLDPYRIERSIHVKPILNAFHFEEALARVTKPVRELRPTGVRLRRALVIISGAETHLSNPYFRTQLEELKQRAHVVLLNQKHEPVAALIAA